MSSPSVLVCLQCTAAIKTNSYKVKCNKCKLWCHRDCANLTIEEIHLYNKENSLECGKKWLCFVCQKKPEEHQKSEKSKKSEMSSNVSNVNEIIIQENNYLKRLLSEMEEKNSLLRQNKELLEQKVADLEHKLKLANNTGMNLKSKNLDRQNTEECISTEGPKLTLTCRQPSISNTPTTPNNTYSQVLLNPGKQFKQNTDGSRLQDSKKQVKKRRQINIGTASIENVETDFTGKEDKNKKAWLFISRIKDHVTEEKIKDYIIKKANITDNQDIVVKKIKTKYDTVRRDCQCFQVGIRFDLKERVYDENFWPLKVAFRRFDFDVNKRTGDNQDF